MLDTDIVSDLIRNPRGKAVQRIGAVGDQGLSVNIIVAALPPTRSARIRRSSPTT
jgi:hypothetical protein